MPVDHCTKYMYNSIKKSPLYPHVHTRIRSNICMGKEVVVVVVVVGRGVLERGKAIRRKVPNSLSEAPVI